MLSQDFAHRIGSAEPVPHRLAKHKPRVPRALWVSLRRIFVKKTVYFPALTGAFLAAALVLLPSLSVNASVSLAQEEWLQAESNAASPIVQPVKKVALQTGDSAISVLGQLGFPFSEVMEMRKVAKKIHPLEHVRAGHVFWREDDAQGIHVFYAIDAEKRLHLTNTVRGWSAEVQQRTITHRQMYVSATISDSFFYAAAQAGMDDRTTMNLVDIFAWDIDFARDLRAGDQFQILYDERYDEDGKLVGTSILAAVFINQGKRYDAIQYQLKSGKVEYYSSDGRSLRKTYLKAPVKYSRISSRFRSSRKHPVLGYTRAHKGVDYAAKTGTPVRAIGDGRISYSTWKGGYGRLVEIRHGNRNHSTRYAHLSKFGRGIHKGVRVKQGQIIGYVGMSGLATGPHLHFEFRVRGRAMNPLRVRHAPAKPVPKVEMAEFQHHTSELQEKFELEAQRNAWG